MYENYSVVLNKYIIGWMNRGQIGGLNRIKSEDWHECRYFSLLLRWSEFRPFFKIRSENGLNFLKKSEFFKV